MTSHDGGHDRDPLDPEYEALFRPEEVAPAVPVAAEVTAVEPVEEAVVAPPPVDRPDSGAVELPDAGVVASGSDEPAAPLADAPSVPAGPPPAEPLPPSDPVADTGRLFRSQGVLGHEDAVLALTSDHYGRLRTLERTDAAPAAAAPLILGDAAALDPVDDEGEKPSRGRRRGPSMPSHRSGITAGAVYIIVFGVTLVVAFLNALIAGGDLGWPTGLALLVSSVYAALVVRRPDDTVAIIVPPLAFLLATLTAGQLFLGSAEGSLLNRSTVVFFTLAANWFWVIGATVAALVIVLVRRRRG